MCIYAQCCNNSAIKKKNKVKSLAGKRAEPEIIIWRDSDKNPMFFLTYGSQKKVKMREERWLAQKKGIRENTKQEEDNGGMKMIKVHDRKE